MIFPYVRYLIEPSLTIPSGEILRPEIPIRIFGRNGSIQVAGLVDTGVDHIFLSTALASVLGAVLSDDHTEHAAGAGGHALAVWPSQMEIEVVQGKEAYRWQAQVGFLETDDDPTAVYLGHSGFLEFFRTTFDGGDQAVELQPLAGLPRAGKTV